MGTGRVALHPAQGFAAEPTSTVAIRASAHMGVGLSTTQGCSGSVIGSGAGRNIKKVRWGTARKMFYGWLLTLPAAAIFGGIAAAIALRGTIGVIIVLAALIAGTAVIVKISRRTAVTSHNVTDDVVVKVKLGRSKDEELAMAGAPAADGIAPIIITQPSGNHQPVSTDTSVKGPQS
jgi:PiT family inorganic phosphate transporter